MGLDTVVEGVETKEQLNMLLDLGVTAVQGHLFALPTPAAVATPTR
jgi:EAL domain-containing protein (putative c-di-GMP-specific phosphodiesterase class I)